MKNVTWSDNVKIIKLVLIGFITTISRAALQGIIPQGEGSVLPPSVFVSNGRMALVFMIYGTIAYTSISAIFLILHKNMGGNKLMKGLKFGLLCSLLWSIYLMEPLPHVAPIDRITYPVVDSTALIIMGALSGQLITEPSPAKKYRITKHFLLNIGSITILFFIGRIIQYTIFKIYSSFMEYPIPSLIWVIATGILIGLIFEYINSSIYNENTIISSFIFGGIIFGVNLFAFNFFMPIIFNIDILDLFLRTILDVIFVISGAYMANRIKGRESVKE
jgi:hypothetical protein